MRIHGAQRNRSAAGREGFPRAGLPEFAFAGRSNVGKSSLLNALVRHRGLARTSRSPGCTQLVHFYEVNRKFLFADLPGYGYAKVPERVRATWAPLVESYLLGRSPLRLVWVLVDSRHPPTELDAHLVEWLRHERIPFRVAMTKSDRLSGNERGKARRRCGEALGPVEEGLEPVLTSAKDGAGLPAVWQEIRDRLAAKKMDPENDPSLSRFPPSLEGSGHGSTTHPAPSTKTE